MPVTLWVREGDAECAEAQAFLRANGYAADAVHDAARRPPAPDELEAIAKGLGSLRAACDARNPRWRELAPEGADAMTQERLAAVLSRHGELLRVPLLVTPRGALAGFRERRWRAFLDIGRDRA